MKSLSAKPVRVTTLTAALLLTLAGCSGEDIAQIAEELDTEDGGFTAEDGGSEAIGAAIQEAATITLDGSMVATFSGPLECRVENGELAYDIGRGSFTGQPGFVFTEGALDEGHQLGMFLVISGFDGPGTYTASVELSDFPGPYDASAAQSFGEATVELVAEERGFDFVNIAGPIDGSYSGELGSGTITGHLGVCGFYQDTVGEVVETTGADAEVGSLEMTFSGDYEGEVIDGFVDADCWTDAGELQVVYYLDESWPFSLIMVVENFTGEGRFTGIWDAYGYGDEADTFSAGPVTIEVEVLHDDDYDEDWGRFELAGNFAGDMGDAEAEGKFACYLYLDG